MTVSEKIITLDDPNKQCERVNLYTHIAYEDICVWKMVNYKNNIVTMRCKIPINSKYRIEDENSENCTLKTYVSNVLDVLEIGDWNVTEKNEIWKFTQKYTNDCHSLFDDNVTYKLGVIQLETGMWSYAQPWQTIWVQSMAQINKCITQIKIDSNLLIYDINEII